ncbi:AAA family ATPase [Mycolicibacterium flavescens]|uniref:Adenylate kinase n=1 Tax=Mycolicibacterium flavescens TaxID=1776 RepID=A0A1E3R9P7_MYCFV|nr:AAA family ATPase [Mycolicibacterium flavescens]MCV7282620.1 AAA family ATPase [Mycolicibacterium flavescens]ODQ86092.1 hypothetical protein BHQ18_27485 [Mycolicibacterium flavescens]
MSAVVEQFDHIPGPAVVGDLAARIRETHTGLVVLAGDRAYKTKKPVVTDFLDFGTAERRTAACEREVELNRRLSPDSYLGVGRFDDPLTGSHEPVIVMRRYPDHTRLAALVRTGRPVHDVLEVIVRRLASFHRDAERGDAVDSCGRPDAVAERWLQNLDELDRHGVLDRDDIGEVRRLATQFMTGRAALFDRRIADRRIVDGHGDLLADDIFVAADHLAILDCLEFDDRLRYVDVLDDIAFLAMDLEFLGRPDLGEFFVETYRRGVGDTAPESLVHFYIAYRAVVRAKVDCVRVAQGHPEAGEDACRHLAIALDHLRAATVQLVVVGGGPGTGKSTLAAALAEHLAAEVISTDVVRKQMQQAGVISGSTGSMGTGLYAAENVEAVYDEVLRRARAALGDGTSVILDGTWRDPERREHVRAIAGLLGTPLTELTCATTVTNAQDRIKTRRTGASDATPQIAAAIAEAAPEYGGHVIDTTRPFLESLAEARQICCAAI